MRDSVSSTYVRQARDFKLLTSEQEQSLAERIATGDTEALKQLVEANLCLVIKIAHEYKGMGVDLDDLVGAGNVGLIRAAQKYKSGMVKFDSYAHHRIRYEMRKIISKMSGVASMSSTKYRTDKLIHDVKQKLGENATEEEISEKCGFTKKHVMNVLKRGMKRKVYLQDNVGDDDKKTYLDVLSEEPCKNQFSSMEVRECISVMMNCFDKLSDRDKYVLESYYGIHDKAQKSLTELGEEFGCSRENMRVIKDNAQKRLKEAVIGKI